MKYYITYYRKTHLKNFYMGRYKDVYNFNPKSNIYFAEKLNLIPAIYICSLCNKTHTDWSFSVKVFE